MTRSGDNFEAQIREFTERSVLCWLATSTTSGAPTVSPKEVFTYHASRGFLIANIASPRSAANAKANPKVCVALLDIFKQKGLQIYGDAQILTRGDVQFEELAEPLVRIAGADFPFKSLFRVAVTSTRPIIAPRYKLFPETTEKGQVTRAVATYQALLDADTEGRLRANP